MNIESEKVYYDNDGAIRTAEAKGRKEGLAEGRKEGVIETNRENARKMKTLGIAVEVITQVTGLSEENIAAL